MTPHPLPTESSDASGRFDGSWERSGRSLNSSAILGLLGIGVLYFHAQSLLAFLLITVTHIAGDSPELSGTLFERLLEDVRFLKQPIRYAVVITQYLFMLAPALWLVHRWHSTNVRTYIRLDRISPVEIILASLATLALIPAGNYIADAFVRQLHVPEQFLRINAEIFTARSPGEFVWLVFVVCITPALCEEIFFRGFVQRTFERTMGWKSVVLVGIIFGLFHFNPLGLVTLSILGLLFGYFFYRTRSLFPAMAAHFTNNFLAVYLLYQGSKRGNLTASDQVPLWLVGITLPIAILLLLLFHRMTEGKTQLGT